MLTVGRKIPATDKWLGQGVEEAVSLTQPENARRILYRLLDERVMAHRLSLLESQIDEQWELIDTLIDQRRDAVALNQDGRLLQVNHAFTNMTGLTAGASKELWLDWLDGPSQLTVQSGRATDLQSVVVKDAATSRSRRLDRIAVQYCGADAELICLDTVLEHAIEHPTDKKIKQPPLLPTTATDSVTGLPARSSLLNRVQKLLQTSDKKHRYTAMIVKLFNDDDQKTNKIGIDRTVQDLTLYRAADVLQKNFSEDTVLGRINQNALLLIKPSSQTEPSRGVAKRVREVLGSLGGVLEEPQDLKINTLNVAGASLSATEVVRRLEQHHA
jgi:GGDEF domain-containing protein